MKRTYWMQLLVLVLAISVLTATSAWGKTKKTAAKTDTDAAKKETSTEKTKAGTNDDKDKDKDKDKNKDKDDADAEEKVEVLPDLTEFYAEVAEVVKLDEEGQKKLLLVQEKKNKALEKFDAKYDKLIVKIENEMDRTEKEKVREKLRAKLKEIEKKREKLHEQADNMALRVLTADQLVTWNTYELWSVISPELEFDNDELELTEEQVDKSKAICDQIAKKMGTKGRIAQNPQVKKMAIGQIGNKVLTKQQRKAYTIQQRRKRIHEMGESKTVIEPRRGRHH
jgi:hypothetical protein